MTWIPKQTTEAFSMLSSVTTTMDAVGKQKRDLELLLMIHTDWPDGLRAYVQTFISYLNNTLAMGIDFQSTVITLVRGYEQETG